MNLSVFSLKVDFALRAAKGLSHFRRLRNSSHLFYQMLLNILAVPVLSLRSTGIPSNAQAALAKIDIRSQIRQIHL